MENTKRRKYTEPRLEKVEIDRDITLIMTSTTPPPPPPPPGPAARPEDNGPYGGGPFDDEE